MSGAGQPDRVRRANALLLRAISRWNAGNRGALEECIAALEMTAAELTETMKCATADPRFLLQIAEDLHRVRTSVKTLQSICDMSAAFLRGHATESASPLYSSNGVPATETIIPPAGNPAGLHIQA